jgi:hypothetical protein
VSLTGFDGQSVDGLRREVSVLRTQLRDLQSSERHAGLHEQGTPGRRRALRV